MLEIIRNSFLTTGKGKYKYGIVTGIGVNHSFRYIDT